MALRIGLLGSSALQNEGQDMPVILQSRTPQVTNPKSHWVPNCILKEPHPNGDVYLLAALKAQNCWQHASTRTRSESLGLFEKPSPRNSSRQPWTNEKRGAWTVVTKPKNSPKRFDPSINSWVYQRMIHILLIYCGLQTASGAQTAGGVICGLQTAGGELMGLGMSVGVNVSASFVGLNSN